MRDLTSAQLAAAVALVAIVKAKRAKAKRIRVQTAEQRAAVRQLAQANDARVLTDEERGAAGGARLTQASVALGIKSFRDAWDKPESAALGRIVADEASLRAFGDRLASVFPGTETFTADLSAARDIDITLRGSKGSSLMLKIVRGEPPVAKWELMRLPPSVQGGGQGTVAAVGMMEALHDVGVGRVDLVANITVGGYAWPKMGARPVAAHWDGSKGTQQAFIGKVQNSKLVAEDLKPALIAALKGPREDALFDAINIKDAAGQSAIKPLLTGERVGFEAEFDLQDDLTWARIYGSMRRRA